MIVCLDCHSRLFMCGKAVDSHARHGQNFCEKCGEMKKCVECSASSMMPVPDEEPYSF